MFWIFLIACSLTWQACRPSSTDTLWLLGPEAADDGVHATDSERSLRDRYGDAAVTRERVQLGEGQTAPGVILFADDSTRRLEIQFEDTIGLTQPIRATVKEPASGWTLYPGVTIGTRLDALERFNGGPFVLTGLGWDYAGTVLDWSNGKLATLWPRSPSGAQSVFIRLNRGPTATEADLARGLQGDRELSSTAMRELNPHVYEISVRPR